MKFKTLQIAAILFVLTMLTSSMVSGTFAKYASQDSSSDSAHVARWGITVFSSGDLYGKYYEGTPTNSIIENDDESVTVKSHNAAILGSKVVAPGTKNTLGLEFGLSGTSEVALKIDVTIRNQNIVLRNNEYFILHKIPEAVTSSNFEEIKSYYGSLYVEDSDSYVKKNSYSGDVTYYTVYNRVDLMSKSSWAYCPIVYELEPVNGTHGISINHSGIKGYASSDLEIGINDKSLDIISYFLQASCLNEGSSWPSLGSSCTYERTVSKIVEAGTNLDTLCYSYSKGIYDCMSSERLTWSWHYQQSSNTELYNAADNILGRLSAEKIYGPLDDDIVVIRDRTYSLDSNGQPVITPESTDSVLIRPVEYEDYCLDTSFDIQMTVSQID